MVEDTDRSLKGKGEATSIPCKYHKGEGLLTLSSIPTTHRMKQHDHCQGEKRDDWGLSICTLLPPV